MTWRTRTPVWILAGVLALAGCARQSGGTPTTSQSSGRAGFGEVNGQTGSPTPDTGYTPDNGPTTSSGNNSGNNGGGGTGGTSPSPTRTGPQIVAFTAKGAVCPVDNPGLPYSSPGKVTISWKISGADTVDLAMDGGLWKSYPGQQGTDDLPFECDNNHGPMTVTHTFKLTIKNTSVWKTVSASAKNNPH
jgi:hypothetical protein